MDKAISLLNELKKASITRNADTVWKCAHRYLWNNYPFSQKEINQAKNFIKEFFEEITHEFYLEKVTDKLKEFCLRVFLACDYVKRKSGRFIPHPVIWFNPSNPHGFMGTKKWYDQYIETEEYKKIRFYHEDGKVIVKIEE